MSRRARRQVDALVPLVQRRPSWDRTGERRTVLSTGRSVGCQKALTKAAKEMQG